MERLTLSQLDYKFIGKIDSQWALLTAGKDASYNTMTVSWGSFGTLWNKPVATVFLRPQRYTREFVEREEYYTLSFFGGNYMKDLGVLGSVSGRDADKLSRTSFTAAFSEIGGAPYFEQAELVLVCKKLYCDDLDEGHFIDTSIISENYPQKDFHRFYIGEIVDAYTK